MPGGKTGGFRGLKPRRNGVCQAEPFHGCHNHGFKPGKVLPAGGIRMVGTEDPDSLGHGPTAFFELAAKADQFGRGTPRPCGIAADRRHGETARAVPAVTTR